MAAALQDLETTVQQMEGQVTAAVEEHKAITAARQNMQGLATRLHAAADALTSAVQADKP